MAIFIFFVQQSNSLRIEAILDVGNAHKYRGQRSAVHDPPGKAFIGLQSEIRLCTSHLAAANAWILVYVTLVTVPSLCA